jgi:hypothetical protein
MYGIYLYSPIDHIIKQSIGEDFDYEKKPIHEGCCTLCNT